MSYEVLSAPPPLCMHVKNVPFFRFGFGVEAKIRKYEGLKSIPLINLFNLPEYLRFNTVELFYRDGFQKNAKKRKHFAKHLQLLKPALSDTNMIVFSAKIYEDTRSNFNFFNHSALIDYLRNKLLPICDSACHYKFNIYVSFDSISSIRSATTNVIAQILAMPQIVRCSNVEFNFDNYCYWNVQLSCEAISNWLYQKCGFEMTSNGQNKRERFLRIKMACSHETTWEMLDYFRKVYILTLVKILKVAGAPRNGDETNLA